MATMAKKKRPGRPRVITPDEDGDEAIYRLRFIYPELYLVVKECAKANHRSINGELNVLLEKALTDLGKWPRKQARQE